jgi:hypothetical protein
VTGDINFTGTFRQNGSAYIGSQWTGTSTLYFAGNVGINTTSVTYPLNVGSASTSTQVLASFLQPSSGTGGVYTQMVLGGGTGTSQGAFLGFGNYGANTSNLLSISLAGQGGSQICITNTGVGIGKTNPGALFQVNASSINPTVPTVHIGDNDTDYTGTYAMVHLVRNSTPGDTKAHLSIIRNGAAGFNFGYYNNTNTFGFWRGLQTTAATPTMSFAYASDYVGIGTTNPTYTLQVNGTMAATYASAGNGSYVFGVSTDNRAMMTLNHATGTTLWAANQDVGDGDRTLSIQTSDNGSASGQQVTMSLQLSTQGTRCGLDFKVARDGASSQNPLYTITQFTGTVRDLYYLSSTKAYFPVQNVGIGITNPGAVLTVVGGSATPVVQIHDSSSGGPDYGATYGMVNLTRGADTVKAHVAFIRAGNYVWQLGYISGTNSLGMFPFNFSGTQGTPTMTWSGGNVGIGITNPSAYTLQVAGTIGASGDITALYSDERLKTKTGALTGALDKVCSLDTFTYRNNELAKSFGFKDDYQRVGVSAQQVQKVLPEAVRPAPFDAENQSGQNYLTVQYEKLVPLLIEALKEERHLRCQLEERVRALEEGR